LAPTADEVSHGYALGGDRLLREQSNNLSDLFGRDRSDVLAVQMYFTREWFEQSGESTQKGRFAASVGADDRGDGSAGDVQIEVVHDHGVPVAE
jgi:hypothetical protein